MPEAIAMRTMTREAFEANEISGLPNELYIGNHRVMSWKEYPFISKSIDLLCKIYNPKTVLEVGYGLGITATQFQLNNVEKHIIIEPHPEIYKNALTWASMFEHKNVKVIKAYNSELAGLIVEPIDLIYDDSQNLTEPPGYSHYKDLDFEWLALFCSGYEYQYGPPFPRIPFVVDGKIYEQTVIAKSLLIESY